MKSVFLVVLLAAAATAAVVTNEVVELPDVADDDEVADVDFNDMPDVVVADVSELADAADLTDVAEKTAVASRGSLSQGTIGPADLLMYNAEHRVNAIAGQVQTRDITVRANERINAIRVVRIGTTQNAVPSVVAGGIGNSFTIIRIRSASGRGFAYRVEVYGT